MRQEVNLYQPETRRVEPWSARGMARWLLLGVLVLAALAAFQWRQTLALEQLLAEQRETAAALEDAVDELEAMRPSSSPEQALQAEVERLERRLAAVSGARDHLPKPGSLELEGYASVLDALARERTDGVWLERIRVQRQGELLLQGRSLRPEAVPAFVHRLGREPEFIGQRFRTVRLDREDGAAESWQFQLIGPGVEP